MRRIVVTYFDDHRNISSYVHEAKKGGNLEVIPHASGSFSVYEDWLTEPDPEKPMKSERHHSFRAHWGRDSYIMVVENDFLSGGNVEPTGEDSID